MGISFRRLLCIALLSTTLAVASCSPRSLSSIVPAAAPATQPQITQGPALATKEIQLILTPTASASVTEAFGRLVSPTPPEGNKTDNSVTRSYHAVLMLERAADLILAVIEKIRAGQISQTDTAAISPYINAFAVAADSFNQASPPPEFEDIWSQVYKAALQYNQAYTMLTRGMSISTRDMNYLKDIRQLLVRDQEMVERALSQQGLRQDFFSAQQQAVDQHLQQAYGSQPVPTGQP